ncbi:hypothetical protein ACF05T_29145 [Streptomyces lateritius]|uniref:Uncharacterized protein n=1 Tax=Streptomyces lateritius TaxID=67313 RepID=A0ABW6YJS8_9ACTN
MTTKQGTFHWARGLPLTIVLDDEGGPRLTHLGPPGEAQRFPRASLPLVEVTARGHGRSWSGNRLIGNVDLLHLSPSRAVSG